MGRSASTVIAWHTLSPENCRGCAIIQSRIPNLLSARVNHGDLAENIEPGHHASGMVSPVPVDERAMELDSAIKTDDDWRALAPGPDLDLWLEQNIFGKGKVVLAPAYTTDIRQAWRIAARLRLLVSPSLFGGWCAGVFQGVSIMNPTREGDARYAMIGTWVERESAEMAICCAAFRTFQLLGPGEHTYTPGDEWSTKRDRNTVSKRSRGYG